MRYYKEFDKASAREYLVTHSGYPTAELIKAFAVYYPNIFRRIIQDLRSKFKE